MERYGLILIEPGVEAYLDSEPRKISGWEGEMIPNGGKCECSEWLKSQKEVWLFAGEDREFALDIIKTLNEEKGFKARVD